MRYEAVYDTPQERRAVTRAHELAAEVAKVTAARDRHVLRMAEIGLPIRAIATEIGLGHGTVQRIIAGARREGSAQ